MADRCPVCSVVDGLGEMADPHVHATGYGYVVWAPEHEQLSFIEEIRRAAYRQGRIDGADPRRPNPVPGFTCPRCGRTSYHPVDIAEGYCGACHDWTGQIALSEVLARGVPEGYHEAPEETT